MGFNAFSQKRIQTHISFIPISIHYVFMCKWTLKHLQNELKWYSIIIFVIWFILLHNTRIISKNVQLNASKQENQIGKIYRFHTWDAQIHANRRWNRLQLNERVCFCVQKSQSSRIIITMRNNSKFNGLFFVRGQNYNTHTLMIADHIHCHPLNIVGMKFGFYCWFLHSFGCCNSFEYLCVCALFCFCFVISVQGRRNFSFNGSPNIAIDQ